jgi:hypothetical protein
MAVGPVVVGSGLGQVTSAEWLWPSSTGDVRVHEAESTGGTGCADGNAWGHRGPEGV